MDFPFFRRKRSMSSVSAARMTVRRHVSWPWRLGGVLTVGLAAIALGAGLITAFSPTDSGLREILAFDSDEINELQRQLAEVTQERDRLRATNNASESRLNIERSALAQLASQIRSLEMDNARLQDDLAFFENLSLSGTAGGVAIKRLLVEPDEVPGHMRYRILVTQGGKPDAEFQGALQLIVTLHRGGKAAIINLPSDAAVPQKSYEVRFRRYQRLEGSFSVPEGAMVRQVQARVLQNGAVRAQQVVVLKS